MIDIYNKEKRKQYNKEYYLKNKEKIKDNITTNKKYIDYMYCDICVKYYKANYNHNKTKKHIKRCNFIKICGDSRHIFQ